MPGDNPTISQSIVGGYLRSGDMTVSSGTVTTPNVKLGVTTGYTGTLTVSGGSVTTGNLYLGGSELAAGGQGTLTVTGGQTTITGVLELWNSSSTATVSNGGTLTTGALNGPAGTVFISDPTSGVALTVGYAGNGNFAGTIADGPSGPGSLLKTGGGTQTLSGVNAYTGGTIVAGGRLVVQDQPLSSPAVSVSAGATLEFNVGATVDQGKTTFSGGGTFVKSGAGIMTCGAGTGNMVTWALGGSAVIDVQAGTFVVGGLNVNNDWTGNQASLNIATGAVFHAVASNVIINVLTGGGEFAGGYPDYGYIHDTIGVNNGSGTFMGTMRDDLAPMNLLKVGSGTQVLAGWSTYTGSTTITNGTLEFGLNAQAPVLSGPEGADVQGGRLVFDYAGGADPVTLIVADLRAGFATNWTSGQIRSSTADGAGCVLGWLDDTEHEKVTVVYTVSGDANLDGVVDINDLAIVLTNYNKTGTTWTQGDVNNDFGVVDINDLTILLSNFGRHLAPLAASRRFPSRRACSSSASVRSGCSPAAGDGERLESLLEECGAAGRTSRVAGTWAYGSAAG